MVVVVVIIVVIFVVVLSTVSVRVRVRGAEVRAAAVIFVEHKAEAQVNTHPKTRDEKHQLSVHVHTTAFIPRVASAKCLDDEESAYNPQQENRNKSTQHFYPRKPESERRVARMLCEVYSDERDGEARDVCEKVRRVTKYRYAVGEVTTHYFHKHKSQAKTYCQRKPSLFAPPSHFYCCELERR